MVFGAEHRKTIDAKTAPVGEIVQVSNSTGLVLAGYVGKHDLENGLYVLENVPWFNDATEQIETRTAKLPIQGLAIFESDVQELNAFRDRMGQNLGYKGSYVRVAEQYGRVASVHASQLGLQPFLCRVNGSYRWKDDATLWVPVSQNNPVIMPVDKQDLDVLVMKSEAEHAAALNALGVTVPERKAEQKGFYAQPIESLNLPRKCLLRRLKNNGINTIGDVFERLPVNGHRKWLRGFGNKSLMEVECALQEKGYLPQHS